MKYKSIYLAILGAVLSLSWAIQGMGQQAPRETTRSVVAAGGKCNVVLKMDSTGKIESVTTTTKGCYVGRGELFVHGKNGKSEPLQHSDGSITFGTGTTTCYGPPNPNPPWCVCTAEPCP